MIELPKFGNSYRTSACVHCLFLCCLSQNSIRHNLSLHTKFQRVENPCTGKSAFWTINYAVKEKQNASRRRATVDGSERCVRKALRHAKARVASAATAAASVSGFKYE